jgi:hypothetical protein
MKMLDCDDQSYLTECYLHNFDVLLCGQVVWNLRLHVREPRIRESIERLPVPLIALVTVGSSIAPDVAPLPAVVFNSDELCRMAESVRYHSFETSFNWEPLECQYRTATLCTGEIRRRLAPAEAAKWSEDSRRIEKAFIGPRLELADGIDLIDEWTTELRRYLEALGEFRYLPRPDGQFPTPTCPEACADVELDLPEMAYLERMRAVITKHEDGKHADANELIKLAHAKRQPARKALRLLEKQGEYCGFERATSKS